mmetsp:Transcript_4738/g.16312  ORF Transcript_4738/g.16312 Transcript_4738/m.16312 type:complete len:213 (-) Transcript_4738:35-673(-)
MSCSRLFFFLPSATSSSSKSLKFAIDASLEISENATPSATGIARTENCTCVSCTVFSPFPVFKGTVFVISFPGWRQKSIRSILLSAYTRVFVLDMISFTVSNIGLLSYSPVLGLTNREVEILNTSSLKSHSPFDASTICVFATFEPRLTSNCVRFVPGRRLYTERTVTWNSYLSAFHPLDFITSLLLLVGPVVPPVPLRENIFFVCLSKDAM